MVSIMRVADRVVVLDVKESAMAGCFEPD